MNRCGYGVTVVQEEGSTLRKGYILPSRLPSTTSHSELRSE